MNKKRSVIAGSLASIVSLLLTGCGAGINVTRVNSSTGAQTGVPWTLSLTQFTIVVSREITECDNILDGKVSVQFSPGRAPDPDQRFLLDSSGLFSTSDITSGIAADGSSTGLNASSQGAAGQILTSTVTTAAQIIVGVVAHGAGVPEKATGAPKGVNGEKQVGFKCRDAVTKAFATLRPDLKDKKKLSLQKLVTNETQTLAQATDKVTLLTAQADKDPSYKKALAAALKEQDKAQNNLTKDQTALAAARKVVTETQTLIWPSTGNDFRADSCNYLLPSTLSKWIAPVDPKDNDAPVAKSDMFNLSLAIYAPRQDGSWQVASTSQTADPKIGVPVRTAAPGRILACSGKEVCPPSLLSTWIVADNQSSKDLPMLQLGQMYNVRVAGGAFKSEGAIIQLDADGAASSIEVTEKTAAAAVAASSATAAATSIAAIPNSIAALKTAQAQAESAQITAETANITYQANLPTALETARAQAQTAADNARTNLATAQANARDAGPAAAMAAQSNLLTVQNNLAVLEAGKPNVEKEDALSAQAALDNAQAAQINAKVSLIKAQSELP